MRYYTGRATNFGLIVVAILLVLVIIISSIPAWFTTDYNNITITKTEIATDGDYMIFGTDSTGKVRSFTLNDSIWHGKWNTADTYALIKEGQTYDLHCSGFRIPLLSMFPNILEVELVE